MKQVSSGWGKPKVSTAVQSDFRENETQTEPWTPKFKVINGRPEVLTLGFMKFKRDLPAWRRTVDAIEFMRKKRSWERFLANKYTPENAQFCKRIITDIEKCETNLIEDDFNRKNRKRLELSAKEADYFNYAMDQRFKEREQFVTTQIAKKKEEKIRAIRAKKTRELRKIDMKQRGVNMKYHPLTPIEEMCDPLSPFHVSVARFGKNPRYGTEILAKDCRTFSMSAYRTVENLWARKSNVGLPPRKKSVPKKHDCSLVKEEATQDEEPPTTEQLVGNVTSQVEPEVLEDVSQIIPFFPSPHQEKDYQAVLLLQTLIRGRAAQNLMYKGRRKNQAIVDEIQSTVAFFKEEEEEVDLKRRRALQRLRYYHLNMKLIGLVALVQQEMLGEGVADLALKSHHEVERMTEESRGYLMALLAERTRWHREAAESGRRQRELRRRDLYDEFFRHLTRRNEITSDFYLKLIQDSVIRSISEKEADIVTKQKADEIEKQDIKDAMTKKHDIVVRKELMARLLHDFYIPQIAKNLERYSLDYYINKARNTAINVITGKAKVFNTELKETSLMELVYHSKRDTYPPQTPLPTTPDEESEEPLDPLTESSDTENEELSNRIESLDRFMKQETMSVIDDADKLGKEADMFRNIIMKQLRAQEDERRKTLLSKKKYSKEDVEDCYDNIYKFSLSPGNQEYDGMPRVNVSDVSVSSGVSPAEEEISSEEEEVELDSKSSSPSDIIDRRLLLNSDGETTTDSEEVEDSRRKQIIQQYSDLPDRLIDELLMQAHVIHANEQKRVGRAESPFEDISSGVTDEEDADTKLPGCGELLVESGQLDDELEPAASDQRYHQWRDHSDFSNVEWSHRPTDTAPSSQGTNEDAEEIYQEDPEVENDSEYLTHDEVSTEEED